jgi:hypothetical protein
MTQQIKIAYLLQRFLPDLNEWKTLRSNKKESDAIKLLKRMRLRHPELQYRVAIEEEITTITVETRILIRGDLS